MYLGWSLILLFANSVYMEPFTGFAIGFSIHRHQLINHARFVQRRLKWLLADGTTSFKKCFYKANHKRSSNTFPRTEFADFT